MAAAGVMSDTAGQASLDLRHRGEQLAARLPPLLVAADRIAASVVPGLHGRRRVGSGETFWQFRHYQPGDAARAVDWRQSAKSERLYVRETEWEAAQSVWLWCDQSPSMDYASSDSLPSKRWRAEVLTMALAILLIRGGEHVGLFGKDRVARSGKATLNRIATGLSAAGSDGSLPPKARLARYSHLVLFSDFLSPMTDLEKLLREYAGQDVRGHLVQLLDPAEEDLPFSGRTAFDGTEGEDRLIVGRVESLRRPYIERMKQRRQRLQALASQLGWSLTSHRTDWAPNLALLSAYGALDAREF
jgi:uncharacterized protein (DUF58 family)